MLKLLPFQLGIAGECGSKEGLIERWRDGGKKERKFVGGKGKRGGREREREGKRERERERERSENNRDDMDTIMILASLIITWCTHLCLSQHVWYSVITSCIHS